MTRVILQLGGGLLESLGQFAVVAGTVLLVGMVVALGSYAYKSLRGDGIEWPEDGPEDDPEDDEDGLSRGSEDDEWEYY